MADLSGSLNRAKIKVGFGDSMTVGPTRSVHLCFGVWSGDQTIAPSTRTTTINNILDFIEELSC